MNYKARGNLAAATITERQVHQPVRILREALPLVCFACSTLLLYTFALERAYVGRFIADDANDILFMDTYIHALRGVLNPRVRCFSA